MFTSNKRMTTIQIYVSLIIILGIGFLLGFAFKDLFFCKIQDTESKQSESQYLDIVSLDVPPQKESAVECTKESPCGDSTTYLPCPLGYYLQKGIWLPTGSVISPTEGCGYPGN